MSDVLWVIRSGMRWADLPERYGKYEALPLLAGRRADVVRADRGYDFNVIVAVAHRFNCWQEILYASFAEKTQPR